MELEFKCPRCGNETFDTVGGIGSKLVGCRACGSSYIKKDIEIYSEDKRNQGFEFPLDFLEKHKKEALGEIALLSCPACMEEFFYWGDEDVPRCIYCGREMLSKKEISEVFKPDGIIPFAVKKEQAACTLEKFCENKPLLPKSFTNMDFSQELKGFFAPVWVLDAEGRYSAAFKVKIKGRNGNLHYLLKRSGHISFENFILNNEKAFYGNLLKGIKPYYFSEKEDFDFKMLNGFFSGKLEETEGETHGSILRSLEKALISAHKELAHSSETELINARVFPDMENFSYILVPMWVLNFNYEGKTYSFAVNGQTGKLTGNIPLGRREYLKYFLIWFAVIAAAGIIIGILI